MTPKIFQYYSIEICLVCIICLELQLMMTSCEGWSQSEWQNQGSIRINLLPVSATRWQLGYQICFLQLLFCEKSQNC